MDQFINNPSRPTVQRTFPAATGKANFERHRFAQAAKLDGTVFFVITREAVETCNTGLFLFNHGPGRNSEPLRLLRGKVNFVVEGYDDQPEPLCAIPPVRKFLAQCHEEWPCWPFFANLQNDCLAMIACCVSENLWAVQVGQMLAVIQPLSDISSFLQAGTPPTAQLQKRIGASEKEKTISAEAIASYFLRSQDC